MLSRELLRSEPEAVRARVAVRGGEPELVDRWIELDRRRRAVLAELEDLKRRRNEASKEIGELKREGKDAEAQIAEVGELKGRVTELEAELTTVDISLDEATLSLPNLAHQSVPEGADEEANRVERIIGDPPEFAFEPKAHWDLGPALGILDFERGSER
jgi:seryl-tRNA synthetase